MYLTTIDTQAQVFDLSNVIFKNENSEIYKNPYTGGIRAPQLNKVDLNFDGIEDLLLFDRAGDVYVSFLAAERNSIEYLHDQKWIKNFPKTIIWMTMVDYDKDGIKDIFSFPDSSGIPGVEVWKGKITNGFYDFDKVRFPEERKDILYYPVRNGKTQVYVGVIDIPAIKDVDGDGDVDILSFDPGASTVDFYKNIAMEGGQDLSVLKFVQEDGCYGRFVENGLNQDVILSKDGLGCGNNLTDGPSPMTRHAGSTLEVLDQNGDGKLDLLIGDASFNGLNLLVNGGDNIAWMTESELGYPSSEPVAFELFLTPCYLDIDNDGTDELMVTSNDKITSQTKENFWYYENTLAKGLDPVLITKRFLSETMIDHGESAIPSFVDYNADGLIDLVIGTSGSFILTSEKEPSLFLYENTGTKNQPEFTLVNDNYNDFNQFKETSSFFAPSFGDIDGDGDIDMIVGDNRGRLYYAENTAGPGLPLQFSQTIYGFQNIQVSGFARPHIFDLNQDGLGDLIIGERNFNSTDEVPIASINYFENIGKEGIPLFENNVTLVPNSPALGGINLKHRNSINNNSALTIWDNQDHFVMITGSEAGDIRQFEINKNDIRGIYEEILSSNIKGLDLGEESAPALWDIDGDNLLELVVGNFRGGIGLYETDIVNDQTSITKEEEVGNTIVIYPNPALTGIFVSGIEENMKIEVIDISGKIRLSSFEPLINIKSLESGIFFIRVQTKEGIGIQQFVKIE